MGVQIAVPRGRIFTGDRAQFGDIVREPFEFGIDHGIGAIGGDHPALPTAFADLAVPFQIVQRAFGRGQRLDLEAVKQCAGAEIILRQFRVDMVVIHIRRFGRERHIQTENMFKRMVQPHRRRRAAQQVVMLGKAFPDQARIGFGRAAVNSGHTQIGQGHTLRHQHAEDVVIGDHEQLGGVRETFVFRKPLRIAVTVGRNNRQVCHAFIQRARQTTQACFDRK